MRHSLQLMAAAAVLALLCGCQTMPTMQPNGPPAPIVTSPGTAPAPIAEADGQSVIMNGDAGVVHTDSGYCDPSCECGDGYGYGGAGGRLGSRVGLQARNMHHVFRGPHGPPVTQTTYPYYTLRGPRDFLVDNPPSLGP